MKNLLLLTVFVFLGTQGYGQTYIGKQKHIDQILQNIQQFSAAVMASDYAAIGAAYTKDGKLFPNNRPIIAGRDAIIDYWTLPAGVAITYHKITPSEITVEGKTAYDHGYYEGRTRNAEGEESAWKGKYVIVWKRVDGAWKMYLDIWNRVAN